MSNSLKMSAIKMALVRLGCSSAKTKAAHRTREILHKSSISSRLSIHRWRTCGGFKAIQCSWSLSHKQERHERRSHVGLSPLLRYTKFLWIELNRSGNKREYKHVNKTKLWHGTDRVVTLLYTWRLAYNRPSLSHFGQHGIFCVDRPLFTLHFVFVDSFVVCSRVCFPLKDFLFAFGMLNNLAHSMSRKFY